MSRVRRNGAQRGSSAWKVFSPFREVHSSILLDYLLFSVSRLILCMLFYSAKQQRKSPITDIICSQPEPWTLDIRIVHYDSVFPSRKCLVALGQPVNQARPSSHQKPEKGLSRQKDREVLRIGQCVPSFTSLPGLPRGRLSDILSGAKRPFFIWTGVTHNGQQRAVSASEKWWRLYHWWFCYCCSSPSQT